MAGPEMGGLSPTSECPKSAAFDAPKIPQYESGPTNFLAAVGGLLNPQEMVGWLVGTGLAAGNQAAAALQHSDYMEPVSGSDPSRPSTPGSPATMPTGGDVLPPDFARGCSSIVAQGEDAFAASRECIERAVDVSATSDLPDVASTPQTMSIVQCSLSHAAVVAAPSPLLGPMARECCAECQAPITGAVFMLHDRGYCCQRHRLVAYHKSERSSNCHARVVVSPTGLRAQYGAWC